MMVTKTAKCKTIMASTYLYTIVNNQSVRVPFDLDTRRADWENAEPYHEPPLVEPLPRHSLPFVVMLCNRCWRSAKRKRIGRCKCGGWMKR